jgi:sialic acid synthase
MEVFMKKFKVVAEIGCVHVGSMERAKMLIDLAKQCHADYAKFQKRNPQESVKKEMWNQPHPHSFFAYGDTYLQHRIKLEFTIEQHAELKEYCEKTGIGYSTSVWDMTSAKEVLSLRPDYIKIPSACNYNFEIIDYVRNQYDKQIHISLGMTTQKERNEIIERYCTGKDSSRFVFYHCTSGYPVPFKNIHLMEIYQLTKQIQSEERIGFSNHGYGIAMEIAAYVLGCRWFERHFVEDRAFRHSDAAASVETPGLSKIIRDLAALEESLTFKPQELEEIEIEQRKKLRY